MKLTALSRTIVLVFTGLFFYSTVATAQPVTDTFNATGVGLSGTIQTFIEFLKLSCTIVQSNTGFAFIVTTSQNST